MRPRDGAGISGASYYEGNFSQISRAPNGNYVAVSSRGNFYLTWEPGQTYWQPHNRRGAARWPCHITSRSCTRDSWEPSPRVLIGRLYATSSIATCLSST